MTGSKLAAGRRVVQHFAVAALVTLAALGAPVRAQMACAPCVVGVVLDSAWGRNDELVRALQREIVALTAPEFDVILPLGKRRVADSTPNGVRRAVEVSLADPEVDLVLTAGPLATVWAGRRSSLRKPVIGTFVFDPELQGLPISVSAAGERASGQPNLSYVTFPNDLTEEMRQFRRVASFTRLTVLAGGPLLNAVDGFEARLQSVVARTAPRGIGVEVVRVRSSAAEALAAIAPAAQAIYVMPLMHLPAGEFDCLVGGLVDRRLPTFSYLGRSAVDAGLLMSLYTDMDFSRLGRRTAIHVQRLLRGEEAGALPIDFRRDRRLTLNMATARAIGAHPDWRLLTEAELLHDVSRAGGRRLSLAMAVREAVAANLDLAADDLLVAAGRQIVRGARAARRPSVSLSAVTQQIDMTVRSARSDSFRHGSGAARSASRRFSIRCHIGTCRDRRVPAGRTQTFPRRTPTRRRACHCGRLSRRVAGGRLRTHPAG